LRRSCRDWPQHREPIRSVCGAWKVNSGSTIAPANDAEKVKSSPGWPDGHALCPPDERLFGKNRINSAGRGGRYGSPPFLILNRSFSLFLLKRALRSSSARRSLLLPMPIAGIRWRVGQAGITAVDRTTACRAYTADIPSRRRVVPHAFAAGGIHRVDLGAAGVNPRTDKSDTVEVTLANPDPVVRPGPAVVICSRRRHI
jgi:hypothetical protein